MKLSYFECKFLAETLEKTAKNPRLSDYQKQYCSRLLQIFKPISERYHSPDGRPRDIDVDFENQIDEKIAELVNQETKAQEKIDLMEKVRANVTREVWQFFFMTIKIVLIFSFLGAILYTIAHLVPKEWAIWSPLPIAAILAIWVLLGNIFDRWYNGHWRK